MLKSSLINYSKELDNYTLIMKNKIKLSEHKHIHDKNTSSEDLKQHLIQELIELFQISDEDLKTLITQVFTTHEIDIKEFKDVSIMLFALRESMIEEIMRVE